MNGSHSTAGVIAALSVVLLAGCDPEATSPTETADGGPKIVVKERKLDDSGIRIAKRIRVSTGKVVEWTWLSPGMTLHPNGTISGGGNGVSLEKACSYPRIARQINLGSKKVPGGPSCRRFQ